MVLLHVAFIDQSPYAGVNVAVKSLLHAQSPGNQCALWNLAKTHADGVETEFLYTRFDNFETLPSPFRHPDLLIFHEIYRPGFLKIYRCAIKEKIPYILIPHGGLTRKAQSVKPLKKWLANRLLFNRFIRCAHGIQYLSDREWQESVPKEKAFLGTNGIDKTHPKDQFRDRVSSIVYIGRLDPYIKGIDILLHALKKQKASFVDHHCHVSLYGPDEGESHKKIKQMIDELDLEEIVTVYPPVLGDRKHQILTEADCFIQTSRSEGMSMGILEALSYGLPCVITAGTSMKADIDLYDAGWTCKTDPADLSVLLEKVLLSSESDLRKKSSGAIRLIQDRFLTEKVTKTTLDKYRSIISTDGGMDECF